MLTVLRHLPLPGLLALWIFTLPLAPAAAQEPVDAIPELVSILEDPAKRSN